MKFAACLLAALLASGVLASACDVSGRNRGMMLRSWNLKEEDIRTLSAWGGNLGRYQMAAGWGVDNANRDVAAFNGWIDAKLDELEKVLGWGAKYGVRIVVDLHVPPGGRAPGGEMNMFHEKEYADLFVGTWRRIARRFKGDRRIYGYDLINEPTNRQPSPEGLDWWSLQVAAAKAVRAEDPDARVIIESNEWAQAKTFAQMRPVPLENVVYQVHVYTPHGYTHQGTGLKDAKKAGSLAWPDAAKGWNREWLRERLRPVREFQLAHGARIYVGEFSASVWATGAENYLADCIALFNEYGWDWTYHALRESKSWNVELAPDAAGKLVPSSDTPRKRALMNGFVQRNKNPEYGIISSERNCNTK